MRRLSSYLFLVVMASCAKDAQAPHADLFRVVTTPVSSIGIRTAKSGGLVISGVQSSSIEIKARGVCYGQFPSPTIADPKTTDGSGAGDFVSNLTGLNPSTKYYLRAYATRPDGTFYGDEVSFTTLALQVPLITTKAATAITHSTVSLGGEVLSDGGAPVVERGICFSITPNPTVSSTRTMDGAGVGSYTSQLSNLCTSKVYYVRAYATNSVGTGYGPQVQFTTADLSGLAEYNTVVTNALAEFSQCLPVISGTVQVTLDPSGDYSFSDASFGLYSCVYNYGPATGISLTVDCGATFLSGSDEGAKSFTMESLTTNGTELTIEWSNSAGDAARTTLVRTGGWPLNLHL